MAIEGTGAYEGVEGVPPLVRAAVEAARGGGFGCSCLPQQGRLLQVLAGGVGDGGRIGETGTGFGVGLAWLASGAVGPGVRLFSVERDAGRAEAARRVLAGEPRVRVGCGDWRELRRHGPFDLLVLDGGGQGKADEPALEPGEWLRPGGIVVLDDFAPMTGWPPMFGGEPDRARLFWLEHPRLRTAEVRVAPEAAALIGVYIG